MQMSNWVVWITGASSGIGKALALEMAARGAITIVSARRKDKLDDLVSQIKTRSGQAFAIPCDVTDEEQLHQTAETIAKNFGHLDVAVANAGFCVVGAFEKLSLKEWRRQLDINVLGVVATIQSALPHLKKSSGRAVVVSSVSGRLGNAHLSAYCASKFALVGMCEALYQEWYGSGVSITNILPGMVESEIAQVGNDGILRTQIKDKRPANLIWPADKAAIKMADAIYKRKREAVITGHGKIGVFLSKHFSGLTNYAFARMAPNASKRYNRTEA